MALALAIMVLGGAVAIALYATWYLRGPGVEGWPAELVARRHALRERVAALPARLPRTLRLAVEESEIPNASIIEAALLGGRSGAALAAAEQLIAERPTDAARHLLLARALLAADQPIAAERAARQAEALGARGPRLDLALGLARHRARAARAPEAVGAESPYPALLSPYELFILELERHRQKGGGAAALWLARLGDTSLSAAELLAAVTIHVSDYCDDLDRLVAAAEAEPALTEASYQVARLAVKLGFIAEARALFDALEPLMPGALDRDAFHRDLATLRDQALPPPPAAALPPIESGRRSIQLKILR